MTIRTLIAAALIGLALPATAETPLQEMPCPTEASRVVILGDSLADGLWAAMNRAFARCKSLDVLRLTQVSDGLARTSAAEWLDRYAAATRPDDVPSQSDLVILQIGTNDLGALRTGNSRARFGSDAWRAAYADQAQELAEGLRDRAAEVLWFGLPIMGDRTADARYRDLTGVQSRVAETAGVRFFDIWEMSKFGNDGFSLNGTVEGRPRQLRVTDRIHFTTLGYELVASEAAAELTRFLTARDRGAAMRDDLLQ